jgi:hypothetical protein
MKYIEFNLGRLNKKTQIYIVRNIKSQMILGYIKWYGGWRQYIFEPFGSGTIFSSGCLKDIYNFINKLMKHRPGIDK